ncbi:MAG TPA: BTAD domain-containing putative transcriptional regulator [Acidimicrobiia bacterium]|nr:BTAD domain-containing putative transcriptional regulator [Acidimicrobiia bacterium]
MYFRILSDIGVSVEGVRHAISAGRQRAAFCVLALASNREVGRAALVDAIWGETVPQHPETALHIIVSRLRTALGPAAPRLVSVNSGYRLDVASDELDLTVVQTQFILGRSLLHDNEPQRAAEVLAAALEPWNEAVLADLTEFPFYERAHIELTELRRSIEEVRNDALLAAGRHVEVLANLQAMITADPWREHFRRQRMIAYYRSGRHVDALREYDDFRALLIEQLGVEPSEELRELNLRILDHDASLRIPRGGVAIPIPAWTATALPFVGRSDEEEIIFTRLREVGQGGSRLVLIEGEAGIGKTRLMLEVARRMGDDTILIPATANDATRGTLVGLAESLAIASARLTDDELRLCLGRWPGDIANAVPAIARRLPSLVNDEIVDDETKSERLRESLTSWVVAMSQRAPLVLLIDDIDRAGAALFYFLGRLFARPDHQRTLVLATARSREAPSTRLELFLEQLVPLRCFDRISLEGLDVASIERLVNRLGRPDGAEQARLLLESTAGHPFFVGELLQSGDVSATVPASVREFVRLRVRNLGAPEQDMLECASCFFTGFDIPLLQEVAGLTEAVANQLVDRALDAGILRSYDVRTFTFVHEITRRAIFESLEPERDAELHRRIAIALEARETSAVILAAHWRRATGDDARTKTHHYASLAANQLLRSLEPENATRWLELAVAFAEDPAEVAWARLALAEAQQKTGDPEYVNSYRAAIQYAREANDAELLTACAVAWTPIWSSAPPVLRAAERIALLEDAQAVIQDTATRSRVAARLATELLYTDQHDRAADMARAALDDARASGSDVAQVEVAMRYFQAVWCPHTLAERSALIEETCALLAPDDALNGCTAFSLAAATAIEAGDLAAADAALDSMLELADAHNFTALKLHAMGNRAWRTALSGDIKAATDLTTQALALASEEGHTRAVDGAMLQIGYLAWQQGRIADLLPIVQQQNGRRLETLGTRIMVARCLAANGDIDGARALLGSVTETDLEKMPKDLRWSGTLLLAAEAAFMVQAEDVGAIVLRMLEPFRDQVVFANFVLAPIAYGAGLAAAATGREDFEPYFEQAVDLSNRLDAPILRARTKIAWAIACQTSGRAAERAETVRALVADVRAICAAHHLDDLQATPDVTSWRVR